MTSLSIIRSTPTDYPLTEDVFRAFGFQQCVAAGNQLHISGVTPLRGNLADLLLIGEGDVREQVEFCLDALHQCLVAHEIGPAHLISTVVYATDLDAVAAQADLFVQHFGNHPPTATWVEVRRLFHPGQMVEISALAML